MGTTRPVESHKSCIRICYVPHLHRRPDRSRTNASTSSFPSRIFVPAPFLRSMEINQKVTSFVNAIIHGDGDLRGCRKMDIRGWGTCCVKPYPLFLSVLVVGTSIRLRYILMFAPPVRNKKALPVYVFRRNSASCHHLSTFHKDSSGLHSYVETRTISLPIVRYSLLSVFFCWSSFLQDSITPLRVQHVILRSAILTTNGQNPDTLTSPIVATKQAWHTIYLLTANGRDGAPGGCLMNEPRQCRS